MAGFSPLLEALMDVPDPRRAQGQLYKLPYVLLFAILAIVTGTMATIRAKFSHIVLALRRR